MPRLVSLCLASLYKRTSNLSLDDNFFFPNPKLSKGHNYENILRDIWVTRIILKDEGIIYVIYASSVRAENDSWNYTNELRPEFDKFFKGIKFE